MLPGKYSKWTKLEFCTHKKQDKCSKNRKNMCSYPINKLGLFRICIHWTRLRAVLEKEVYILTKIFECFLTILSFLNIGNYSFRGMCMRES